MALGDAGIDKVGFQTYFMHTQDLILLTRKSKIFYLFKSAVDRYINNYSVNVFEKLFKPWIFEVFWNDTHI